MTNSKTTVVLFYALFLLGYLSAVLAQSGPMMPSPGPVSFTTTRETTEITTTTVTRLAPSATETRSIVIIPSVSTSTRGSSVSLIPTVTVISPTATSNKPSFGMRAFDIPRLGLVPSFVAASLLAVAFVMALA